jgi:hypothetical protein
MSNPTRQSIVSGPGAITFGSQTFHDKDGIEAVIESSQEDAFCSQYGRVASFKADQTGRITFTPCGDIAAAQLAVLFKHTTPVIGASLFGSSDAPCVVHSLAGVKLTATAAALVQLPSLSLSPVRTALGPAAIAFLVGNGLAASGSNALYKIESASFTATAVGDTTIKAGVYLGTYNTTTIHTQDGWEVSFDLQTTPVVIDDVGTVDLLLSGLTVRASCTPVGITEADFLALQPHTLDRGASMVGGYDLTIATATVGGLSVVLKNARPLTGPLRWGAGALRAGQLGFEAHRSFAAGVGGALYSVGVVAGA